MTQTLPPLLQNELLYDFKLPQNSSVGTNNKERATTSTIPTTHSLCAFRVFAVLHVQGVLTDSCQRQSRVTVITPIHQRPNPFTGESQCTVTSD